MICENRFVNIAQSKARRVNTLSCKHARVLLVRVTTLDQSCVALKRTLSVHSNYRPDLHPSQFGRIFGTFDFFSDGELQIATYKVWRRQLLWLRTVSEYQGSMAHQSLSCVLVPPVGESVTGSG